MKQFWTAVFLGGLLLGALVAFAVLPGESDLKTPTEAQTAAVSDVAACRAFELSLATTHVDDALVNINQAADFERGEHGKGLGFFDWLDEAKDRRSLNSVVAAGAGAGTVPGLSSPGYEAFRGVVVSASDLALVTMTDSMLTPDEIDDRIFALSGALADVERVCE